jgi:hypothetical protein
MHCSTIGGSSRPIKVVTGCRYGVPEFNGDLPKVTIITDITSQVLMTTPESGSRCHECAPDANEERPLGASSVPSGKECRAGIGMLTPISE